MNMTNPAPSRGLEWTNLALGAGLFCSAFLFGALPVAALSAAITGLLVVTCSMLALYRFNASAEWSNLALGSWALLAPFVLGFNSARSPLSIHLVIGLCVVTIATMQLVASRNATLAQAALPNRKSR
jgi:hypothetical protein